MSFLQEDALNTTDRKHLKLCAEYLSEERANALDKTQCETLYPMKQATLV
jgi:hypothetical protein